MFTIISLIYSKQAVQGRGKFAQQKLVHAQINVYFYLEL